MTKIFARLASALIVALLLGPSIVRAKDPFCPEFTEAAYKGDLARVKTMLAAGVDIESTDGSGTALLRAACNGQIKTAQFLVRRGARLEAQEGGATALALAIYLDHFATARMLAAEGARLDGTGDYDHSPLHYAIEKQRLDTVKWLLRQGANPNLQNWRRSTPLMEAVDNPQMVRLLLRMGADVNVKQDQGQTALSSAIYEKQPESVRLLLASGARQHRCRWDESAVIVAVKDGTPEILRLLLRYHPRLEARTDPVGAGELGQTALEIAQLVGNHEAVRILREHSAREVSLLDQRLQR